MKEISRGAAVNFIGNVLRLFRVLFIFLAAWLYGAADFGVYVLTWATAEILLRFCTLSLEKGLLFDLSYLFTENKEKELYSKIASSIKLTFALSLLTSIGLAIYCHFFTDGEQMRRNLYIVAMMLPVYCVTTILIHCTMGLKEMKYKVLIRDGAEPLLLVLGIFVFSFFPHLKPYGIILAHSLATLVTFFLSCYVLKKYISFEKLWPYLASSHRYYELMRYSLPIFSVEIFDVLLFRMDLFLLGGVLGTGSLEEKKLLGIYGLAKRVSRSLIHTKNAFDPIFLSVTSEAFLKKDQEKAWKSTQYSTEKLLFLNVAFVITLLLFGREVMHLFGEKSDAIDFFSFFFLVMGQFFYSTFALVIYFLIITKNYRRFLLTYLALLTGTVLVGPWIVKHYQMKGAALISGLSYSLAVMSALVEVFRIQLRSIFSKTSLRILIASVLAIIVALAIKNYLSLIHNYYLSLAFSFIPCLGVYFLINLFRIPKAKSFS